MKGYHIYSQFREDGKYDVINHLGLLASILTWKKNFGSIHLYTVKVLSRADIDAHNSGERPLGETEMEEPKQTMFTPVMENKKK